MWLKGISVKAWLITVAYQNFFSLSERFECFSCQNVSLIIIIVIIILLPLILLLIVISAFDYIGSIFITFAFIQWRELVLPIW